MSTPNPQQELILNALRSLRIDELDQDPVAAGMVKNLKIESDEVSFDLVYGFPAKSQFESLRKAAIAAVRALPNIGNVSVSVSQSIVAHAVARGVPLIPNVKNIIAVASGKGGVGKSTTSANLALALAAEGARVGLLDADIYGPSMPTMLGASGRPETLDGKSMEPLMAHGLQVNSIGFLIDNDQAMVWRGPMVSQALDQLLRQTNWKDLDYLIIDMPPGTGDVHLSLAQSVPITGALIVTTPQEIALMDARKGLKMFEKVSVAILGIIENMSLYACPKCGHLESIFGEGGGQRMADDYGVPLLGKLPLNLKIRERADEGMPMVLAEPESEIAGLYLGIARRVSVAVARIAKDMTHKFPSIVVKSA